ncbi:MAG: ankyrin repeat domain-containing protein [Spirosomaceae bacterium]|jgi:ankyrin repeat protein|nr:ankyrin repeat domain-containing protein [Spirosomataceae bacterium]
MGGDWKDMFRGVETNDFDLVKYHIRNGIDLNYQHPEFLTSALIESIRLNHLEMMEFLLKNGASPDVKEAFSNKSPMAVAKETRNKEAIKILNRYLGTNEALEAIKPTSFFRRIWQYLKESTSFLL